MNKLLLSLLIGGLIPGCEEQDGSSVVEEVVRSLESLPWKRLEVMERKDPPLAAWRSMLHSEWRLVKAGKPAVPHLMRVLGHGVPQVRLFAARALGRIGDQRAVEPLASSLDKEGNLPTRVALAEALGILGGDRAEESLRNALSLPDSGRHWDLKRELEESLKNLGKFGRGQLKWEFEQADESLVDVVEVGKPVPDLNLLDTGGQKTRLSALWSRQRVVLFFFFDTFCMYCNGQINQLRQNADKFAAKGARVVCIVPRIAERIAPWSQTVTENVTFLSDPASRAQALFGVAFQIYLHEQWFPSPTCAFIEKGGVLKFLHRGKAYNDRTDLTRVLSELSRS